MIAHIFETQWKDAWSPWEISHFKNVKEVVGQHEDLEGRRENRTFASNKEMEKPESSLNGAWMLEKTRIPPTKEMQCFGVKINADCDTLELCLRNNTLFFLSGVLGSAIIQKMHNTFFWHTRQEPSRNTTLFSGRTSRNMFPFPQKRTLTQKRKIGKGEYFGKSFMSFPRFCRK